MVHAQDALTSRTVIGEPRRFSKRNVWANLPFTSLNVGAGGTKTTAWSSGCASSPVSRSGAGKVAPPGRPKAAQQTPTTAAARTANAPRRRRDQNERAKPQSSIWIHTDLSTGRLPSRPSPPNGDRHE